MRNKIINIILISVTCLLSACEENEVMPSYTTKNTSVTHTMATLKVSKTQAAPLEQVTLTLTYVNATAEPLKTITLRAKVDAGAYVDLQTWDVSQDAKDELQTKTVPYVAPATPNVTVTIDMVITSEKELPQIKRATLPVK